MTLELRHFNPRLNQWLRNYGSTSDRQPFLTEQLNNTLLEFFFPGSEFSCGQMDSHSTAKDLENHPDGHVLLLSSKSRLLYGAPECLEVIEKLCPDRKDRGAYGSIFLGACHHAIFEKLNVLVVDDATGENGGILPKEVAYKLVGDCYGQISTERYHQLTQRKEGSTEPYRVVQHRFGWRESDGNDRTFRFGKGTLRPYNFNQLSYADLNNQPQIDLLLPLSSFKGKDKDNPNGATKPQIQPGLYSQQIWLGEKSLSQKGKTAISQIIPSFPKGLKDYIEKLEAQAKRLAEVQNDPRELAAIYCEKYEQRQALKEQSAARAKTAIIEVAGAGLDLEDRELDEEEEAATDPLMYRLLKADLAGHCQLLETEKVRSELARFVQKQWKEIATGRAVLFERALIIPSKELKNGEICVPWLDEGEQILNFRSPFLNSNGLCVSTNRQVEDSLGPDGEPLEGAIVVNDETRERIQARIKALKDRGIDTDEIVPTETESERQGRDFDGDCIGVARASDYPNLTEEAIRCNLPDSAYAPTVKQQKQSFYRVDGSQPSFEEIAIHMSDSISVGAINNLVTALVALESEIEILKSYGTFEQQSAYIDRVAAHYQHLFQHERTSKHPQPIRAEDRGQMQAFVDSAHRERTPPEIALAMSINRGIYRQAIEAACFENQIAVDLFKSSAKPDMEAIASSKRYLYRQVDYIKDKKSPTTYLNRVLKAEGFSPVELIAQQTNAYFESCQLESQPMVRFAKLFNGVEFTPQQKNEALLAKQQFDEQFNEATLLKKRLAHESGPFALVETASGKVLEIANLTHYGNLEVLQRHAIDLRLERGRTKSGSPTLLALAEVDGRSLPIGTLTETCLKEHQLQAGMKTQGAKLKEIKPELQKSQVDLLFQKADEIAKEFYQSIPDREKLAAAAAAWSVSATRQDEVERSQKSGVRSQELGGNGERQGLEGEREEGGSVAKKVSNFVFAAFGDEIISRLSDFQFTEFQMVGWQERLSSSELTQQPIEIRAATNDPTKRSLWAFDGEEYREIGQIQQRDYQFPIGTSAVADVAEAPIYTATATVEVLGREPVSVTIREISKFDHAGITFNHQPEVISFGIVPVKSSAVYLRVDGKRVGELDGNAIAALKSANYLAAGNRLKVKLNSVSTGSNSGVVIATTPLGNSLRINRVNSFDFKNQHFTDSEYRNATLEVDSLRRRPAVLLDGKVLGVLFFDDDKKALKQLGLLQPERIKTVTALLNSNYSARKVKLDPDSVELPKQWTKESGVRSQESGVCSSLLPPKELIDKLTERPTVLFSGEKEKRSGIVGLAVDARKLEVVTSWLKDKRISFQIRSSPQESQKGVAVLYLDTKTIAIREQEAMGRKFGETLDTMRYREHLHSLPHRPESLIDKSGARSQKSGVKKELLTPSARPLWERNLLQQAFEALGNRTQARLGKSHTIKFEPQNQTLSLVNNSSGEVVYQVAKGGATVERLTPEQKEYFEASVARADLRVVAERTGAEREMEMEY
jgi:hypothetical protein